MAGLVVYSAYWACDPKLNKSIKTKDAIVTFFVEEHLSAYQGLAGLFIAGLLSGALRYGRHVFTNFLLIYFRMQNRKLSL